MHYIDPHLLNTFITLAEAGKFTRAANIVGLSQSAVTQQLQKLEGILGVQLIHRSKKQLELTAQGEVFYERAKKLLYEHQALITEFNENQLTGQIRFGSPEDFATHYLPSILSRFNKLYPNIQLEVNCELTLNLLNAFDAGQYDLIVFKEEPGHTHANSVSLWKEPLIWAYSKDIDVKANIQNGTLRLVSSPSPCVYRNRAMNALDNAGIQWHQAYTSPSLAGTIAALRGGLGIAALPATSVPKDLYPPYGASEQYLPRLEITETKLMANSKTSPAIQHLQEFIKESLPIQNDKQN
jgi:DNA-binding transcriptional LysR family regulator